jgi:PLP dependent protein
MTTYKEMTNTSFADRLNCVEERIQAACTRAGRAREDVTLIAVSKGHGPDRIEEAVAAGVTLFGESKVQEARIKIPQAPASVRWHLIGHLQTNKVKFAVELFEMVHSVDSLKLLEALNQGAAAVARTLPVFLEVNVSGEMSKFGLTPDAVPAVLEAATRMMSVDVVGLMTIPPFAEDPEAARPHFRQLCAYRDEWRRTTGFPLDELSMGMSDDLEVAIEEGATWVRVGTYLFGKR